MRLGSIRVYTTTSNGTITLSYSNPLVLYNIKILAINPKMNLTITITNTNGDKWGFTVSSGTEIAFKKINYQSITFNDTNQYTIYYTLQAIYTSCQQELRELEEESDISIVPINNVIITSPLDPNGNLMVNVEEITQTLGLNVHGFVNTLSKANTPQPLSPPSGYPSAAQAFVMIYNPNQNDTLYIGDLNGGVIPLSPSQTMSLDIHKSQAYLNIESIYWVGPIANTDQIGVMYA